MWCEPAMCAYLVNRNQTNFRAFANAVVIFELWCAGVVGIERWHLFDFFFAVTNANKKQLLAELARFVGSRLAFVRCIFIG